MQMSFFDFEEFNELKAEAKKKEAPRKKKEEKQKKKSAPKTVYKLPLTLKSMDPYMICTRVAKNTILARSMLVYPVPVRLK